MSKIYIIGDSFAGLSTTGNVTSWSKLISKNYPIEHISIPGGSNQEIMLAFLNLVDNVTPADIVVLGWSSPHRFYVSNSNESFRNEAWNIHYKYFYNDTVSRVHYEACLNKVKQVATDKNIRLLVFWSFPSDHPSSINWSSADFHLIPHTDYIYDASFDNEIKPALIYFSRLEIPKNLDDAAISKFYANDRRPGHINDVELHKKIYNIVVKFYNNEIRGCINLEKVCNE